LEPLNPTLVYLVQEDVDRALAQNFERRGPRFRDYVIRYTTDTPIARRRGWQGYQGMAMFWREFVALTDELFQRLYIRKCRIDNSAGNWEDYDRQVLACLLLPLIPERDVSQREATKLIGVYKDRASDKEFTVRFEDGALTIDLFLETRTKLVQRADGVFLAEGWHFEIRFESDGLSGASVMRIGGRDVDYLSRVGTVADKTVA
jgi:hypothetical protein